MEYNPFYANFVSKIMRRLKKNYFIALFWVSVGILGLTRVFQEGGLFTSSIVGVSGALDKDSVGEDIAYDEQESEVALQNIIHTGKTERRFHPIYSVPSFSRTFPDLQDVHIISARKWGVSPVRSRRAAESMKEELVFVGANPFYKVDPGMNSSIPYLVPRAARLLETIARNYLDSLYVKGIPMHKILVSSVLRTEEDIERLLRINVNASPESCHRFGTTFDIPYNRYHTVSLPNENRLPVQNDTLKWVLAEVLRDVRAEGLCYIKYEVKQGCFHITTR